MVSGARYMCFEYIIMLRTIYLKSYIFTFNLYHLIDYAYPVLVNVEVSEVWIVHQLVWLNIDGRLSSALVAHAPVQIKNTPKLRT